MKRSPSSSVRYLFDPLTNHERAAERSYGAKSVREVDDDVRVRSDLARVPGHDRPVIRGTWSDGSAARDMTRQLAALGLVIDRTQLDPPGDPLPFENNAPLFFRGTAPSVAIGGSTIVGTTSGANPQISLNDANDNSGRIVLVTGAAPSAAGVFATITFVRPRPNGDYLVAILPADPDALGRPAVSDFGGRTTALFTVQNGTTFGANTSYHYDYVVIDRASL